MAKKRIIFHGYLRERCPEPIELDVESAAEAVKAVQSQTDALKPEPGRMRHQIRVVGFDTPEELAATTDVEEIHIVPDLSGGKGFFKIVLGAALIGLAFVTGGASIAAAGALEATWWGSMMLGMGASLILGGIMEMISPAPKMDLQPLEQNPEPSKYLGTPKNTVAIGTRIPMIYGEHLAYGHYLSFDVDSSAMVTTPQFTKDLTVEAKEPENPFNSILLNPLRLDNDRDGGTGGQDSPDGGSGPDGGM